MQDLPKIERPCGNFKAAYLAECEASNTPVREDIAFDVEHLFSANNVKEFNLEEFEGPLSMADIKCLLGALRFNPYFTALKLRNIKLEKDQAIAILACLRANRAIESLSLAGLVTGKDFYADLFKELSANKQCAVRELNFSENKEFGDTGAGALANWVSGLSYGVSVLDLSQCQIRGKGIATVCTALKKNSQVSTTLTRLDLSGNRLEAEGSSALAAFLAQPNALTHIFLHDSATSLDLILGALNRGTSREIRELDISSNKMAAASAKASGNQLSGFVRSSSTLIKLNISATGITSDIFKELLIAIKGNPYLLSVELVASKNSLGVAGGRVLMEEGGDMTNITSLDVSDNEFDDEAMIAVCSGLSRSTSVKRLDLSRNLPTKGKSRDLAVEGLINLITSPESALEYLTFCGSKGTQLGADMLRLIDAMGDAVITGLDITGHAIGNKGASSLGKMLQSNHTLSALSWDENGTTLIGFKNFRKGLKRNTTLKYMSLPILDIEAAISKESDKPGFLKVIRDLESCIVNNNSPKSKFKAKDAKGGNEFLFFSTSQREALEHHIVKLKSKGKKPSEEDQVAIKDAENFETVIGDLHIAKADALQGMEAALKIKLQKMAEELSPFLAQHLDDLKRRMIGIIQEGYASLDESTVRRIGTNISFGTREVDVKELQEVMVIAAGADIGLRADASFQSAVDIAADYCFEKIEDNLIQITERLQNEVEEAKKPKKVKKHKKDGSRSDSGMVKDSSSGSLASKSKKKNAEESDDDTESTTTTATTVYEDVTEEPEEYDVNVQQEEDIYAEDEDTNPDLTAQDTGSRTPPVGEGEGDDTVQRTTSAPQNAFLGPPSVSTMGGSGPISVPPKKLPPALPKSGPPPLPKFKLPSVAPPAVPGGNGSSSPTSGGPSPSGSGVFAPKGPPPKVPSGFPPKSAAPPMPAVSGGAGSADKPVPGKLAPMLVQLKIGSPNSPGGAPPKMPSTGPPVPGGGPPKMAAPAVPGAGGPVKRPPVAAAAAPAAVATPDKSKDKEKDKKEKEKKDKKDTPSKTTKAPASTKSTKKGAGAAEPFMSNVSSQGAGSGLSAASTQVAEEGALAAVTETTGGPMADPRANRAAGAARRRPPTRRPQGPTAT